MYGLGLATERGRPLHRIRFSTSTSRCSAVRKRLPSSQPSPQKGIYEGFDSDFAQAPVDVYAKALNLRAAGEDVAMDADGNVAAAVTPEG